MGPFFLTVFLLVAMTHLCFFMSISWERFAVLTRRGLTLGEVAEPTVGEPKRELQSATWIRVGQVCGLVTGERELVLLLGSPWSMDEPGVWFWENYLRLSPLLVRVRVEPGRLLGTIIVPIATWVIPALALTFVAVFLVFLAQLSISGTLLVLAGIAIVIGMRGLIERAIYIRYSRQYLRELSQWLRDLPSDCQVVAASR